MQRPFGLNLELPRRGSRMVSVFDPSVDAFVLAEQTRSGNLVVHDKLDSLAMLDIGLAREWCLCHGRCVRFHRPPAGNWRSSSSISSKSTELLGPALLFGSAVCGQTSALTRRTRTSVHCARR